MQSSRPWWEVFGVMPEASTAETVLTLYPVLRRHRMQNPAALLELNAAVVQALGDFRVRQRMALTE